MGRVLALSSMVLLAFHASALPHFKENPSNPALVTMITPGLATSGDVWTRCAIGMTANVATSPMSCTGTPTRMTPAEAKQAVSAANTNQLYGRKDWKLPSMGQLSSLLTAEYLRPPNYETDAFPNLDASLPYWGTGFFGGNSSLDFNTANVSFPTAATTGYVLLISSPAQTHQVTVTAGANGSIAEPSTQAAAQVDTLSFNVTPDTGYVLTSVTPTSGNCLAGVLFNSVQVIVGTNDCSLTAVFARNPLMKHISTQVTPVEGGALNCSPGSWVSLSDDASCQAVPAAGYELNSLTCDATAASGDSCVFDDVREDHAVSAEFRLKAAPAAAKPVPTLGQWALIGLSFVLALVAMWGLRRRPAARI